MVYAQTPDTINTLVSPEKTSVQEDLSNQDIHKVEIKKEKQEDSINRTIDILTAFATLMSILVGIITLIVLSIAGFGFFEYRRWKDVRKKAEQNAKIIEDIRDKAQEDADRLREEASKLPLPSSTSEPKEEIKEKFSEISSRLKLLEFLNIDLKPEDYYNRAVDLIFKKRYEDALKNLGIALELKPDFAEAFCYKGVALAKLDRHEDALKAYDKALELKPDYTDAWYNKGVASDKLDRHEDALKAYDKALELKPNYTKAWVNKGVTLAKLDRHEDALKAYDKALELKPDYADAWYNKGCLYSGLRNKDEVLSCLRKAINIDLFLKENAKTDEDFKWFWDDEDFKKIVS